VTVSHPHHPLYGQQVEVLFVRRGSDPDLIVRLPTGEHAAIAQSWTHDGPLPVLTAPASPLRLLAVDGLRHAAQFIAQLRAERGL
jgi:hypothetical protein